MFQISPTPAGSGLVPNVWAIAQSFIGLIFTKANKQNKLRIIHICISLTTLFTQVPATAAYFVLQEIEFLHNFLIWKQGSATLLKLVIFTEESFVQGVSILLLYNKFACNQRFGLIQLLNKLPVPPSVVIKGNHALRFFLFHKLKALFQSGFSKWHK